MTFGTMERPARRREPASDRFFRVEPVRGSIRRIVDSVASGQKYHLEIVFADGSAYHSARLGAADVTVVLRNRAAEWRMAVGGVFEFLESRFNEKYGLDVRSIENCSRHYHRTVIEWPRNCETRWEEIRAIDPTRFGEKFRRTWLYYLGGAAEPFAAAREIINCYHITFVKGHFAHGS